MGPAVFRMGGCSTMTATFAPAAPAGMQASRAAMAHSLATVRPRAHRRGARRPRWSRKGSTCPTPSRPSPPRPPRRRRAQSRRQADRGCPAAGAASRGHAHAEQQELFVVVAARLADGRFAGLPFNEVMVSPDDADAKKEILLLSPSILVPCLSHDGIKVWDTLAIGEYLAEVMPQSGLLPADRAARAHCRAISGEMHSGFASLRSALPMNLKGDFPGYKVWVRRRRRHRPHRRDLARMHRPPMAGPSCSAPSAAWPTRCTRRWPRAFSPTT